MSLTITQTGLNSAIHLDVIHPSGPEIPESAVFRSQVTHRPSEAIDFTTRGTARRTIKVLSLDGGGVREGLPIHLLAEMEKELKKPLATFFDYIAGTSAGGIAAVALTVRDPQNLELPRYNAQWLQKAFPQIAKSIFPPPDTNHWLPVRVWNAVKSMAWEIDHPQYSTDGLEAFGKEYFQDACLKDSLKPVLIPTYQLGSKMKTRFINRAAAATGVFKNLSCTTAVCMTAAAPTFFQPYPYEIDGKTYGFMDGGLFANCPMQAALFAAQQEYGSHHDFAICSFGTGYGPTALDKPLVPSQDWGLKRVVPNLLDLLLNAQVRAVETSMKQLYHNKEGYFRWQVEMENPPSLDDSSPAAFQLLQESAQRLKDNHPEEWNAMIRSVAKEGGAA